VAGLLLLVSALVGCSTLREARGGPGQRLDPWENWNRKVFAFNEGLDEKVLEPVATFYSNLVPQLVRQGVDNFFGNAADGWSAINNFLQGKIVLGFQDSIRVGTNTLFGILGLFDVASEMGIERHNEDFGQTLGHWGVGAGAYVVWPVLGPSTVRESMALPLDIAASPALLFNDGAAKYSITALRLVNARANLLAASRMLDDIALDKYSFIRDAYLQRRRSLVLDGEEPPTDPADAPEPSNPPASAASAVPAGASAPASAAAK
jgi:phospholipid-binding lipoprotein MlaA